MKKVTKTIAVGLLTATLIFTGSALKPKENKAIPLIIVGAIMIGMVIDMNTGANFYCSLPGARDCN